MSETIGQSLAKLRTHVRERFFAWVAERSMALAAHLTGKVVIAIDYPPSVADVPRYGYGKPPHQRLLSLIERDGARQLEALHAIAGLSSDLRRIELHAKDPLEPSWINNWLPALDSATIYGFVRLRAPRLFLEIGSGNSTLFADRARRDGALETQIVSIDPQPRADIDRVCDRVIRSPLEAVDLALFEELAAGDVLYFDGSHRVFMNSDVAVFFLDILPALPAGVLVGIHDINLPNDYSPATADRYYSEQYMLAAYLLGGADVGIVLPAAHVSRTDAAHVLDELWSFPELRGVERHGGLFWFETR